MTSIKNHANLTCNEQSSIFIARIIAKAAKNGDCIILQGDLGTGKTTFARAFIQELCGMNINVSSPTFNISQIYNTIHKQQIYHYDLYRIENYDELFEIGLEESLTNAINLIEWPEIAKNLLPDNNINILFAFSDSSDYRHIKIEYNEINL